MTEIVYISPWGEEHFLDEEQIIDDLMELNLKSYGNIEEFLDENYKDCLWQNRNSTYNDKYYEDLEERYYRYDWEAPKYTSKNNKILVPFINRVFPNIIDNTPDEFIYRFVKFSFNNDCNKYEKYYRNTFDLKNYRYFNDVVSIIDAFIEMVTNRLDNKIICRIILGVNYINFIN